MVLFITTRHASKPKFFIKFLDFDFTKMFSTVVKPETIQVILTLAPTNRWPLCHLDINNAFLNGL